MYLQTPLNKGQDKQKRKQFGKRETLQKKQTRKEKKLQAILPEERKKRPRYYLKEQPENKKTLRKTFFLKKAKIQKKIWKVKLRKHPRRQSKNSYKMDVRIQKHYI